MGKIISTIILLPFIIIWVTYKMIRVVLTAFYIRIYERARELFGGSLINYFNSKDKYTYHIINSQNDEIMGSYKLKEIPSVMRINDTLYEVKRVCHEVNDKVINVYLYV